MIREHDKVFAEIQFGNKFVASVSQEDETDRLIVELPGLDLDEAHVLRKVPLLDFIDALKIAANKLVHPLSVIINMVYKTHFHGLTVRR